MRECRPLECDHVAILATCHVATLLLTACCSLLASQVLESHHAASLFRLLLLRPDCSILACLDERQVASSQSRQSSRQ